MASKSRYRADEKGAEIAEMLDSLTHLLDRTKVLYEQYFMGIQKTAPSQLHRDIERKIRELTQNQIRNTALRYRLTTLTQKFGSYNTYWRRTMREIEQGRYIRDIRRAQRRALRRGEELPEEIVAAMPKLMRDRIRRDRERLARRAAEKQGESGHEDLAAGDELGIEHQPAVIRDARPHVHSLDENMLDDDIDALFSALTADAEQAISKSTAPRPAAPESAAPESAAPDPAAPSQPLSRRATTSGRFVTLKKSTQPSDQAAPPARNARPSTAGAGQPDQPDQPAARRRAAPLALSPDDPDSEARKPSTPGGKRAGATTLAGNRSRSSQRQPRQFRRGAGSGFAENTRLGMGFGDEETRGGFGFGEKTRQGLGFGNDPTAQRPAPPRRPAKPASARPAPNMSDAETRNLYQRYVQARKLVGESTDVSYERMVKTLNNQRAKILKEHNAKDVEFKVVIKNDKAILKAKPKR